LARPDFYDVALEEGWAFGSGKTTSIGNESSGLIHIAAISVFIYSGNTYANVVAYTRRNHGKNQSVNRRRGFGEGQSRRVMLEQQFQRQLNHAVIP
jgi:hypothetical protein